MRTVNKELLRQLLMAKKNLKNEVAMTSQCSVNLLDKMMGKAYERTPRDYHCREISDALGVDVDLLFPPVDAGEGAAS